MGVVSKSSKFSGRYWRLGVLMLGGSIAAACYSAGESTTPKEVTVLQSTPLHEKLIESSGLTCSDTGMVTINDSGNTGYYFNLSYDGKMTSMKNLKSRNNDWEAITEDDNYFYIGDVGNNKGWRDDLAILKVDKKTFNVERQLIQYFDNNPSTNLPYAHDFDGEALVAKGNDLYLFSKSWSSHKSRIYKISKEGESAPLNPIATLDELPGVITGAAYDAPHERFILTGYVSSKIGLFKPFIVTVTEDWAIKAVYPLDGFAQVEGVCVHGEDVYFTQEESPFDTAKLVKIRLPDETGSKVN